MFAKPGEHNTYYVDQDKFPSVVKSARFPNSIPYGSTNQRTKTAEGISAQGHPDCSMYVHVRYVKHMGRPSSTVPSSPLSFAPFVADRAALSHSRTEDSGTMRSLISQRMDVRIGKHAQRHLAAQSGLATDAHTDQRWVRLMWKVLIVLHAIRMHDMPTQE